MSSHSQFLANIPDAYQNRLNSCRNELRALEDQMRAHRVEQDQVLETNRRQRKQELLQEIATLELEIRKEENRLRIEEATRQRDAAAAVLLERDALLRQFGSGGKRDY